MKTFQELAEYMEKEFSKGHSYESIANTFLDCLEKTFKVMDSQPNGGLTGFQASWVLGTFYCKLMNIERARIQDISNLMYPQYESHFTTITKDDFGYIQKLVKEELQSGAIINERVLEHWQSVASGKVPFGLGLRD